VSRSLARRFYDRPTLVVAEELLGRTLVFESPEGAVGGRIVEVEAYIGADDPACHAVAGRTARNHVLWGPPGHAYVYFTYGMHHCLNVVTEADGFPAAVLIRALAPTVGRELLAYRQGHLPERLRLSGPGRLCAGLGISRAHDGLDLTASGLSIGRGRARLGPVARGTRVGIRVGQDRPWRLAVGAHPSVSGPALEPRRARPAASPGVAAGGGRRRVSG